MKIVYQDGAIIDVVVENEKLQSRTTTQERIVIFGCDHPDANTLAKLQAMEFENGPLSDVLAAMVAAGSITQQRADEIAQ